MGQLVVINLKFALSLLQLSLKTRFVVQNSNENIKKKIVVQGHELTSQKMIEQEKEKAFPRKVRAFAPKFTLKHIQLIK